MSGHLPLVVFAVFLSAPRPSGNTVFSKKLFSRVRASKEIPQTPQFAVSAATPSAIVTLTRKFFILLLLSVPAIERQDFVILPDRIANMREQSPCNRF
jgi:hypothetical protein